MMVWKRVLQTLRGGTGTRLVLVSIYAVLTYRFYMSGQDRGIFIGMFRMPDAASGSSLMSNLYAICFMVFGVVLPLEQPSKYLSIPETMVYVRRRRGWSRFVSYCMVLSAYCLAYAGLQLAVALAIVKEHSASLTAGAVCAGWTVMALLLTVNLGYLGGNRAFGYLAAMVSYLVPLSYVPLMRSLVGASVSFGQPRWIAVLLVMTIALVVANYALFKRLEII